MIATPDDCPFYTICPTVVTTAPCLWTSSESLAGGLLGGDGAAGVLPSGLPAR